MFRKASFDLDMIDVSSKMSLKMSCLQACDNDVAKARGLYEFLSEGIADIPDVSPSQPGAFEQVKQNALEIVSWLSDHKGEIAQGITYFQSLRKTAPPVTQIPPIPKL